MKRMLIAIVAVAAVLVYIQSTGSAPGWLFGKGAVPHIEAKSAILIDANTGQTIFAQGANKALPPASMSKLMTELVVLETVRAGKLGWKDQVTVSPYAANVLGAGAGLRNGERHTVKELFESMAVHSANDSAVALAEWIGGSEREFVKLMNEKAKAIGLSDSTVFANATGLSSSDLAMYAQSAAADGETVMTARDVALLARYMIRSYPEVLTITSREAVGLNPGASDDAALRTTNLMLPGERFAYPGSDGLKTGYTERAGYCFTGTTSRGGTRLIAVVMGAESADGRFIETERLYDLGFGEKKGAGSKLAAGISRLLLTVAPSRTNG
ncbi:peptidase S11 D-alanyl-D-alanine carboxypeptidase 1 [Paenibacillus curdlanolyticus YK9]|uniref:Peptidase S11 D-alanyl-D-alanine carboxypeptidase 1 n=1 Tax=Paenibacillus curdlanolyticus YK9 TaxID=717606 RepID=E0IE19_9BACL|nr:D-alanyl-D-alanine carboxypeptidase family protein [Paenibacillus curdlanolyticus]EFM09373.1 peptidase S11 D-alanyl-D-alanine carboxypeptidase 1 [Paenibacillus curdlanolyticus YK9]